MTHKLRIYSKMNERRLDEDRNEANAKQAMIVMMLDKT